MYWLISGTVEVLSYPDLKELHTLHAATAGCYCMAFQARRSPEVISFL